MSVKDFGLTLRERFELACNRAEVESRAHKCVRHVCAVIGKGQGDNPHIVMGYIVMDWIDATTVASYENGREL